MSRSLKRTVRIPKPGLIHVIIERCPWDDFEAPKELLHIWGSDTKLDLYRKRTSKEELPPWQDASAVMILFEWHFNSFDHAFAEILDVSLVKRIENGKAFGKSAVLKAACGPDGKIVGKISRAKRVAKRRFA
jgi:hypothetical protein